jgi:hypothetical protein
MRQVISFILLFLISVNSFADSDIENRFNEYIVAFAERDAEAVKALLSPNGFTMKSITGEVEKKEEWLRIVEARSESRRNGTESLNITVNSKTISTTGNSANINGVYTWKLGFKDNNKFKISEVKMNFSQTWERINNIWLLTSITNSKIQEPNKSLKDAP